jgi:hypothetical protein
MAYENSALEEGLLSSPVSFRFDKVVGFKMGGEWLAVDNAADATRMLADKWPSRSGPSYKRALTACRAYLEHDGSPIAARAAFTVAVMELGLLFRLFEDMMAFMDFQVEVLTEEDIRRSAV